MIADWNDCRKNYIKMAQSIVKYSRAQERDSFGIKGRIIFYFNMSYNVTGKNKKPLFEEIEKEALC